MVKPFGTRELIARISPRAGAAPGSPDARKVVHSPIPWSDFERRIVTASGEELKLTPVEYNLLCYFLAQSRPPAHATRYDSELGVGI